MSYFLNEKEIPRTLSDAGNMTCPDKPNYASSKITDANIKTDTIINSWYIPDAHTALKIAEAVWLPMYGSDIYSCQPFNVSLQDSVWVVDGSLPEDRDGGVPYIEINGADSRILQVYHGK